MQTLSMPPAEATPIGGSCFSFASQDGRVVYFSNLEPFDSHDELDRPGMLLRIARFGRARRASRGSGGGVWGQPFDGAAGREPSPAGRGSGLFCAAAGPRPKRD